MDKNKKTLLIGGIAEAAVLIFVLVLSILVWTTMEDGSKYATAQALADANFAKNGAFLAFFQNNTTYFFVIICVPVFLLIAVDFIYFAIVASRKESSLTEEQKEAIKKKAEAEVRAELMKEIEEEEKQASKD